MYASPLTALPGFLGVAAALEPYPVKLLPAGCKPAAETLHAA